MLITFINTSLHSSRRWVAMLCNRRTELCTGGVHQTVYCECISGWGRDYSSIGEVPESASQLSALRVLIDAHMQTNIENAAHSDLMLIDLGKTEKPT